MPQKNLHFHHQILSAFVREIFDKDKTCKCDLNDCACSVDTKKVEKGVQSKSVQQFLAAWPDLR